MTRKRLMWMCRGNDIAYAGGRAMRQQARVGIHGMQGYIGGDWCLSRACDGRVRLNGDIARRYRRRETEPPTAPTDTRRLFILVILVILDILVVVTLGFLFSLSLVGSLAVRFLTLDGDDGLELDEQVVVFPGIIHTTDQPRENIFQLNDSLRKESEIDNVRISSAPGSAYGLNSPPSPSMTLTSACRSAP